MQPPLFKLDYLLTSISCIEYFGALRRLDVQIPAPHHLTVHLKSLIISFLTVEHYVSVADAATAVLVFGKFN